MNFNMEMEKQEQKKILLEVKDRGWRNKCGGEKNKDSEESNRRNLEWDVC